MFAAMSLIVKEKLYVEKNPMRRLRSHIVLGHREDPDVLNDDLSQLMSLRSDCASYKDEDPKPLTRERCHSLLDYYRLLCLVQNRFPLFSVKCSFSWKDAFKPELEASQDNIHLEKAAVLFNLGALYSQLGLGHDTSTVEGRRNASQDFLAAATAFSYLRQNESFKASVEECTVDLSVACSGMLESLMLAQAQELVSLNFLEESTSIDAVKAKLCSQVLKALNAAPLSDSFEKSWSSYAELKSALFYGEACLLHEVEATNFRPARLSDAMSRLRRAVKSADKEHVSLQQEGISLIERLKNIQSDFLGDTEEEVSLSTCTDLCAMPSFSVVGILRELLYATNESMFSNEIPRIVDSDDLLPLHKKVAFSRYTSNVDEKIGRMAQVEVQETTLGVKSVTGEEEPTSERFKMYDKIVETRSSILKSVRAGKSRADILHAFGVAPTFQHDGLAVKFEVAQAAMRRHKEVHTIDVHAFEIQLEKITQCFNARDYRSSGKIIRPLEEQLDRLHSPHALEIAASLDSALLLKAKLETSKPAGFDFLSEVTEFELTTVAGKIEYLVKMKKKEEEIPKQPFPEMMKEVQDAFARGEFKSCKTLLNKIQGMIMMRSLVKSSQ
ncbi:unnamed protein product [Microthlaspi erraticum]|uniref:BRO1 domain-containing protein n=1 Tax=Microthlaspi erraticum TaxID=1685480 RepID=A0A6D2I355_9BRAS|nr:unnamed protein product [Microthlaspi erraticum]